MKRTFPFPSTAIGNSLDMPSVHRFENKYHALSANTLVGSCEEYDEPKKQAAELAVHGYRNKRSEASLRSVSKTTRGEPDALHPAR
jgi:hypothetical protein